jgi:hypothetical protein
MDDKTQDLLRDLMNTVESEHEVDVTAIEAVEFSPGYPAEEDVEPEGAEIEMTVVTKYDTDNNDGRNDYRVK